MDASIINFWRSFRDHTILAHESFLPQSIGSWAKTANLIADADKNSTLRLYILSVGHAYTMNVSPTSSEGKNKIICITIKHKLAPFIPDSQKMAEDAAKTYVKDYTWTFMRLRQHNDIWTTVTNESYAQSRISGILNPVANKIPETLAWPENPTVDYDQEAAIAVLKFLAGCPSPRCANIAKSICVAMYVGLNQRGTITEGKLACINNLMRKELSVDGELTAELVKMIYREFGMLIDEKNAQIVLDKDHACWSLHFSVLLFNIKIILYQTVRRGLTAISTIRTALFLFKDFPWPIVALLLPIDVVNATQALTNIRDNPFYGFAKDQTGIASTKYKSLAYVAKELLVKYGGPSYAGLKEYAGWTKYPAFKARLDGLIKKYSLGITYKNVNICQNEGQEKFNLLKAAAERNPQLII